ncbi:MAG: formylglycine-generating enzyme family protein [Rhodospirillales bacterium]|jgi:formylglycine-generating enzyme required for sulfatase activity
MTIMKLFLKTALIFFSVTIWTHGAAAEATKPKTRVPGNIFRDCPICPEMTIIPAGSFMMGSSKGKRRELPITLITIENPLGVSRYEITFDEWDACHTAGGCEKKPFDRGWGRGKRPVINVTQADISEYMDWLTQKTGHKYRLPSEAEWEYAARAGTKTEFTWGDHMLQGAANCRGCGTEWSGLKSAPVGQFKPNPWGLFDVHGNVLEHVTDCWTKNHNTLPIDGLPLITDKCLSKVVKGGAWYYLPQVSRSSSRARNDTRVFSYFIGFRAFREVE